MQKPHPRSINRLAVDIGGTFTDVVLDRDGARSSLKLLTTPAAPEQAVGDGIAAILEGAGARPAGIDLIPHGPAPATDAVIRRKGAATPPDPAEGVARRPGTPLANPVDQY